MTKNYSDLFGELSAQNGGICALAPMSGVTDAGFRAIAARFGASYVVTEMVASDQLVRKEAEALLRAEGRGIAPHVVQLAGCEATSMGEAARVAEASGADVIDINMGCPAKRVTNGWSGSALMRDLDVACGLIAATVNAVKVPVTLKTRLGWDDATRNAPELARRAADLGVRLITIHGRTRRQFYNGMADWEAVARVREAITLPLVVNGDIASPANAKKAMQLSGANGVMVGRAAMGQPWLCGEIAAAIGGNEWHAPSARERADAAVEHYAWLLSSMGRDKGLRHARKHVAAYLDCAGITTEGHLLTLEDADQVARELHGALCDARPVLRAA